MYTCVHARGQAWVDLHLKLKITTHYYLRLSYDPQNGLSPKYAIEFIIVQNFMDQLASKHIQMRQKMNQLSPLIMGSFYLIKAMPSISYHHV